MVLWAARSPGKLLWCACSGQSAVNTQSALQHCGRYPVSLLQVLMRLASECVDSPVGGLVAREAPLVCGLAHPNLVRAYRYASHTQQPGLDGACVGCTQPARQPGSFCFAATCCGSLASPNLVQAVLLRLTHAAAGP